MLLRLNTITRRSFGYFAPCNVPNYLSPELWTDKEHETYQHNWKIDRLRHLIKNPDEEKWLKSKDINILNDLRDNIQLSVDNLYKRRSNQNQYIDEEKQVIERLKTNSPTDRDVKICEDLINGKIDKMYKKMDTYNENIDRNNRLIENISQIVQNSKVNV